MHGWLKQFFHRVLQSTLCFQISLHQYSSLLELQLLQEREQNTKKMQAMRLTCQSQIVNMATTVKEYFKKTMEHTSSQHKKELERVHCEGIQEGMRRLRGILQNHMVTTFRRSPRVACPPSLARGVYFAHSFVSHRN